MERQTAKKKTDKKKSKSRKEFNVFKNSNEKLPYDGLLSRTHEEQEPFMRTKKKDTSRKKKGNEFDKGSSRFGQDKSAKSKYLKRLDTVGNR